MGIFNHSLQLQIPFKLDPADVRVSSLSPTPFKVSLSTTPPPSSLLRHFPSSSDCSHCCRPLLIVFARPTKQDDHFASEETQRRTSFQSCGDNRNAEDSTHSHPFVDSERETIGGFQHDKSYSIKNVALCVCAAVIFGGVLGMKEGVDKAFEFFAGYLLEQSLSVDNLFVFVLIFRYFKVPVMYQNRVLSYGIAGAIFFRASIILLGTVTLQRFDVVNLVLASILIFSSYKLFRDEDEETDLSNNFVVRTCQKFIPVTAEYDGDRFFTIQDSAWKATPLLLTVAVIELSDIAFAIDSIPAVFGVTRDPLVVFSSNLFAILGLRSLYSLISESMSELDYLQLS